MKNNSKRIAAAVLAFCITAGAMPAIEHSTVFPTAYAAEAEDGGKVVLKDNMLYTEYTDHISLLYCEPDGEVLIIPDMIDGKPVTEIDEFAFIEGEQKGVEVPALPDSVKRVVIPESVKSIGVYAFSGSTERIGFEEVLLPETLKEIGSSAFSNNTRLNVYGLSPNTVLGNDAFYNTRYNAAERANHILKDNMLYTEYDDHIALAYCEPDGETLIIPDMIDGKPVTEIEDSAFTGYNDYGIEVPDLPTNVKRIVIPESVKSIGDAAFVGKADHSMLEEVLLPETLKSIGDYAFTGHPRLNVYGLSENTVLGTDAFNGSRYNVAERSNYIFKDNMIYTEYTDHISLMYCEPDGEALIIPDMIDGKPVTEIGDYAFTENSSSIFDMPALPESVKRIVIPESVKFIGECAFRGSYNRIGIEEVLLPEKLKEIGSDAFSDNFRLNVYGLSENTVVGSGAFEDTRYNVAERANYTQKDDMLYIEYTDHISLIYCEPDGEVLMIPEMIDGKPVTEIADHAFHREYDYEYFKVPALPESVKRVIIPESVKYIGEFALVRIGFEEAILPETLKEIGRYAFCDDTRLNVYGLSENTVLGEYAFDGTRYDAAERVNYTQKDDMLYIEYTDHISLIYCEPDGEVLMIPDMIDGKPVTEIADCAFVEGDYYEYFETPALPESVKRVVIPESVKYIGKWAFQGSKDSIGLEEVYLSETLKEIGEEAFAYNRRLNVYGLSENTVIGNEAFRDTRYESGLRLNFIEKDGMIYWEYPDHISLLYCEPDGDTLYIPDMIGGKPVTEIRYFWRDESIELPYLDYLGITIPALPDSVKKVYIPEGVETLNGDCFACPDDKEGLYEVYLPSTLKKVWDGSFSNNKHLNVYGLPETAEVDHMAFYFTRFDVGTRSNTIEKNGMIYKEYPDHITLYYCEPEGDTLYIPDMIDGKPVTEIWYFWRDESIDLPYLDYLGITIPALPDSVKKVYIPEGVETLNGDCFACPDDKEGLYEVYLPSTLKKVWEGSFSNNKHLNVYGLPETAEVDHRAFYFTRYDVDKRANLIVKDDIIYVDHPDHVSIIYCEPNGDTLSFPDMVDGKPVTEICGNDVSAINCYVYGIDIPVIPESVKKVVIPEGVKVGENAFAGTKFEGQFTTAPASDVMYGDANLDGKVTLADSLAILQFIANEDKYPLSEQAQKNADCYNPGDGITGNDAVAVMRLDTKTVNKLPIIEK